MHLHGAGGKRQRACDVLVVLPHERVAQYLLLAFGEVVGAAIQRQQTIDGLREQRIVAFGQLAGSQLQGHRRAPQNRQAVADEQEVLHGAALGEDPHAAGNAAGVEDQLDVHVLQNDAAGKTDGPEERGAVALHDGAPLGVGGVRVPPGEQAVADQLQHSAQVVVDELPPLRVLDELIGGQRQRGPQCHGRKANDGAFFPAVAAGGQPQKEERTAAGDDGGVRVSHIVERGGFEHGIGGDEIVFKDEGDIEEVEREPERGVQERATMRHVEGRQARGRHDGVEEHDEKRVVEQQGHWCSSKADAAAGLARRGLPAWR